MSTIEVADDKESLDEALEGPLPVLVDFVTPGCGPCRAMEPALRQFAADLAGRLTVVKVNIEVNPDSADEYGIQSVPTLILFEDGEVLVELSGARTGPQLMAELEPYL